mmetsp:Transcript_9420/g.15654  ORF Transcript_9420/g.15654 Transcript_9420/m.15654 type:complete len:201 (-) Transcript_9420:1758-2360(-)
MAILLQIVYFCNGTPFRIQVYSTNRVIPSFILVLCVKLEVAGSPFVGHCLEPNILKCTCFANSLIKDSLHVVDGLWLHQSRHFCLEQGKQRLCIDTTTIGPLSNQFDDFESLLLVGTFCEPPIQHNICKTGVESSDVLHEMSDRRNTVSFIFSQQRSQRKGVSKMIAQEDTHRVDGLRRNNNLGSSSFFFKSDLVHRLAC